MFVVAELGPLDDHSARAALAYPAAELEVAFTDGALTKILDRSAGYPYFLQTWGYHTWNVARDDPISARDVTRAQPGVGRVLDEGFFAARVARVPESERRYLRALASLGPGTHPSGAVAAALGTTTSGVGARHATASSTTVSSSARATDRSRSPSRSSTNTCVAPAPDRTRSGL